MALNAGALACPSLTARPRRLLIGTVAWRRPLPGVLSRLFLFPFRLLGHVGRAGVSLRISTCRSPGHPRLWRARIAPWHCFLELQTCSATAAHPGCAVSPTRVYCFFLPPPCGRAALAPSACRTTSTVATVLYLCHLLPPALSLHSVWTAAAGLAFTPVT